jgi:hypothetical protein
MKYNVSINEKSKTITVTLADGTVGVAKCCPTDRFDIGTGIELALERAKVAKKDKSKPTPSPMGVTELVKALEKALPKGQMVLVGNGDELTKSQKEWLRSLAGGCDCSCKCKCDDGDYYTEDEIEDIRTAAYDEGYDDGYNDGYAKGEEECNSAYDDGYNDGYADAEYELADEDEESGITDENIDILTSRMRELFKAMLG